MSKTEQIYNTHTMEIKLQAMELKKEGRSYSQIANALNISTGTVKSWWHRYQKNGNNFYLDKRGRKGFSDQESYIRKLELENAVLKKFEEILMKEGRK